MNKIDRCSDFCEAVPLAPFGRVRRGELDIDLSLKHGGAAAVRLAYEIVGPEDAPVLFVAGGISAGRHAVASDAFPEHGWWQAQAQSFRVPDYRLLSIDWVGADGALDRPIDPADQAEAIVRLLDYRRIDRLAGFIGASYGAMVGMHLAARHPRRLGGLLAISAADRSHPFSSASRALQRSAIELGEAGGDPAAGVALARALAMLTYRTPLEFADRFAEPPLVDAGRVRVCAEDYLRAQGERHCRRMTAAAYRRLSESIDLHRIDPGEIRVPLTLVAVDQDSLVPLADIERLAAAVPGSTLHCITSRFGHDAFLKEEEQVAAIISQFINSLEHAR